MAALHLSPSQGQSPNCVAAGRQEPGFRWPDPYNDFRMIFG